MTGTGTTIGLVYHPDYLIHTNRQHPERKERLEHILAALEAGGLMERLEMIEPLPASVEDLALIHDQRYIASIEEACRRGPLFLDPDTYVVPQSYQVALLAAGGALSGLRKVMEGSPLKVFVLNRPPGHHAERDRAMGFCLFNNIAIAAAAARRDYGLKKIAIVDWDVHHGNGTQHSFYERDDILFISTHQSPAYPGTGRTGESGRGRGEGYTVNIPLPPGCGDAEYALFFDRVILPVLDQYRPELLLVSAGQDAYRNDHLAGMALTGAGYFAMAQNLAAAAERWCGGRVLLCLEGGYDLQGQAQVVIQVLNALGQWGLPVDDDGHKLKPGDHIYRRLEEVLSVQKAYWEL